MPILVLLVSEASILQTHREINHIAIIFFQNETIL